MSRGVVLHNTHEANVRHVQEFPALPAGPPEAPLLVRLLQDGVTVDKAVRTATLRVLIKAMVAATSELVRPG